MAIFVVGRTDCHSRLGSLAMTPIYERGLMNEKRAASTCSALFVEKTCNIGANLVFAQIGETDCRVATKNWAETQLGEHKVRPYENTNS